METPIVYNKRDFLDEIHYDGKTFYRLCFGDLTIWVEQRLVRKEGRLYVVRFPAKAEIVKSNKGKYFMKKSEASIIHYFEVRGDSPYVIPINVEARAYYEGREGYKTPQQAEATFYYHYVTVEDDKLEVLAQIPATLQKLMLKLWVRNDRSWVYWKLSELLQKKKEIPEDLQKDFEYAEAIDEYDNVFDGIAVINTKGRLKYYPYDVYDLDKILKPNLPKGVGKE